MILKHIKKSGSVPGAQGSVPLNATLTVDEPFPVMLLKECFI